jgi:MoaA/NifB/PqqE/SkfB family radical SAM enzyme
MNQFVKLIKTKNYEILFNSELGFEMTRGINGNPDPFSLEFPSLLDIGIMGHCKNKCYFCYQGKNDEPNMKLEDFKWLIDHIKNRTNQVALGGRGDPNLHENFKEIIEYTRKNKVVPNYTTSGRELTDEQIEISKLCGAVAVSDYGQTYTYDAIRRFIDAGIKTNIHMIFNKLNYEKCIKLLSGFDPWFPIGKKNKKESDVEINNINAIIFLLYKPIGEAKNKPELFPTKYQMSSFLDRLLKADCKFKVGIDSCLANYIFKYEIPLTEDQLMTIDSCEGARMSGYISPSLKMIPCSFADQKYAVDLKKQDIDYIWNRSKIFESFRSTLRKNPHDCPVGF